MSTLLLVILVSPVFCNCRIIKVENGHQPFTMLILNETEANNHASMIKTQMKTNITTSFFMFISSLYIPLENKIQIFVLYTSIRTKCI